MVRDPDGMFEQVSRAVADGEAIDWNGLITADDPESRALIEQLRVLEGVARLHRDTLPDPAEGAPLPPPPLQAGDFWGHLTLRGELGRGARGHVYRAWDPQLDREVALKLSVDRDPERSNKDVITEARLLAKVRHPHIATIFGAERRSGLVGLWMELIEGETLEAMLVRVGRFNAREAALIGIEVCSALSAVHSAGLLHRDIKAQNVMRDRNGRLVLMDFGTSRDVEPTTGEFVHDEVGTPLYMAPELFVGGKASVQSDIYSVGVLLYRLVTGSVPVEAHSPNSLRAAHLKRQRKALADVRSDLPLAFVRVVERAIAIDPAERYPSTGALEMALAGLLVPVEPQRQVEPGVSRRVALLGLAAGALLTAGLLGAWWWTSRVEPRQEIRFTLPPASTQDEVEAVAVSPDGRRLAFVSAGRLHRRDLDVVASHEYEQTQGARDPFWSPDGEWVAFFKGTGLWKVRASGGEPISIAQARRPSSGSWAPDGTLLYTVEHGTQILSVPSGGGTPRVVRAELPGVRTSLWWPTHVGDGSAFVYSAVDGTSKRRTLYLARLSDDADAVDTPLLANDSNPLASGDRLFYTSDGALKVQRLDVAAGRLVGEPARLAEGLRVNAYGFGNADVGVAVAEPEGWRRSDTHATLAFVGAVPSPRTFTILDAQGRTVTSFGALDSRDLRVSPDGSHLAYEQVDDEAGTREIWVMDLQRQSRVRLTQHAAEDLMPVWSRDGRTIYFLSKRTGQSAVFAVAAQGGQREQELFSLPGMVVLREVTPDGRSLVYEQLDQQGGWDIWMRALDGSGARPLVQSAFNDQDPAVSPDGRFLAYSSPESGGRQIWLTPLPADGRRWRISSDYGRAPLWSPDGRAIYFHGLNKTLTRVAIDLRPATPAVGRVEGLFTIPFRGYDLRHHFDLLPDNRFIVNAPSSAEMEHGTVIVNRLLP